MTSQGGFNPRRPALHILARVASQQATLLLACVSSPYTPHHAPPLKRHAWLATPACDCRTRDNKCTAGTQQCVSGTCEANVCNGLEKVREPCLFHKWGRAPRCCLARAAVHE